MQDYISRYYEGYDEDGRLASKFGQVEFLTTMHYVEKYIRPGMKILEIGAGTGRYSHTLARQGYSVTAVELVQKNIDIMNSKTLPGEDITVLQGNALDLDMLEDESFDIVLLLGPMYHLYEERDQKQALGEAFRVTKKGGVLMTAYCISDLSVLEYGFVKGNIHSLIEKGLLDTETFKTYSTPAEVFQLYRRADIENLMGGFEFRRLNYVATDMMTRLIRDTVNRMDDATFALYMKYHLAVCEREDMTGATNHSLDIVKKCL